MTEFKVIDISKHNGNINWVKVKAAGIKQVMIRAGYGFYNHDKMLEKNVAGAEANGIDYGFYVYSYATNMEQATYEVEAFLKSVSRFNPTMPIVIDTEDADGWRRRNGLTHFRDIAKLLKYQLKRVEDAGYYAMWYANLSWARSILNQDPTIKRFDLWLAHWAKNMGDPGMKPGMWQYTESGPRFGDSVSTTDMNIAFKNYPELIKNVGLNGIARSIPNPVIPKTTAVMPRKKSILDIAKEVIAGKWGNGETRRKALIRAGYDYDFVQSEVDRQMAGDTTIKAGVYVKLVTTRYADGTRIPTWVKKKVHKVTKVDGNKVLLGSPDGINSWVSINGVRRVN